MNWPLAMVFDDPWSHYADSVVTEQKSAMARVAAIRCVEAVRSFCDTAQNQTVSSEDYRPYYARLYRALRAGWEPICRFWPTLFQESVLVLSHSMFPVNFSCDAACVWMSAAVFFRTTVAHSPHLDSALVAWRDWPEHWSIDVEEPVNPEHVWAMVAEQTSISDQLSEITYRTPPLPGDAITLSTFLQYDFADNLPSKPPSLLWPTSLPSESVQLDVIAASLQLYEFHFNRISRAWSQTLQKMIDSHGSEASQEKPGEAAEMPDETCECGACKSPVGLLEVRDGLPWSYLQRYVDPHELARYRLRRATLLRDLENCKRSADADAPDSSPDLRELLIYQKLLELWPVGKMLFDDFFKRVLAKIEELDNPVPSTAEANDEAVSPPDSPLVPGTSEGRSASGAARPKKEPHPDHVLAYQSFVYASKKLAEEGCSNPTYARAYAWLKEQAGDQNPEFAAALRWTPSTWERYARSGKVAATFESGMAYLGHSVVSKDQIEDATDSAENAEQAGQGWVDPTPPQDRLREILGELYLSYDLEESKSEKLWRKVKNLMERSGYDQGEIDDIVVNRDAKGLSELLNQPSGDDQ